MTPRNARVKSEPGDGKSTQQPEGWCLRAEGFSFPGIAAQVVRDISKYDPPEPAMPDFDALTQKGNDGHQRQGRRNQSRT
jgi:hypothetical protein